MAIKTTSLRDVLKNKLSDEIKVPTIWVDYDGTMREDYEYTQVSSQVIDSPSLEYFDNTFIVRGTILQVGSHVTNCGPISAGEVSDQLDLSKIFRCARSLISLTDAFCFWDFETDLAYLNITELPFDMFKGCPNLTVLSNSFMGVRGIKTLPAELFAHNPKLNNLYKCFLSCTSLKTIPGDLFKNNHNLGILVKTFERTGIEEIPADIFSTLQKDTEVGGMFSRTKALMKQTDEYQWPQDFDGPDKKYVVSNIFAR